MDNSKANVTSSTLRRRKRFEAADFFKSRIENILTESSYNSVQFLDIEKLRPFKNQKRSYFDDEKISSLAATIREHGIRQPLTVIQSEDVHGIFEIVSGERRFLAAKKVGLSKVPCIVIHNKEAAEEIAIIENVQRVDLHPIELGRAYESLLNKGIVRSNVELAAKIGVPRTQVSEYIGFSQLPEDVALELIKNDISSRRVLRKITKCSSASEMREALSDVMRVGKKTSTKLLLKISLVQGDIVAYVGEDISLSDEQLFDLQIELEKVVSDLERRKSHSV